MISPTTLRFNDSTLKGRMAPSIAGFSSVRITIMVDPFDKTDLHLAGSAFNKLLKVNHTRDFATSRLAPPTGLVFHYTSADGLKGMVEQDEIWATSAYFLNDSAEITYGYGPLKEVLEDWIATNPSAEHAFCAALAQDLQRSFGQNLLNKDAVHPIYLACFCEEDNLLSQWRTYGKAGGYSLGFKVQREGPTQDIVPEPCVYTARWVKVDYDRDQQRSKCRKLLQTVMSIFDNPGTAGAISSLQSHGVLGYQALRKAVEEMLLEESLGFKSKAFEVEKEWRIIVRKRELLMQGTDDGGKTPVPIHFRSLRGMLTPYVKLIPIAEAQKLPIVSVRSGPTFDKTASGMAIRMILDKNGYPDSHVKASDISVKI
jgi:hypothetical protein